MFIVLRGTTFICTPTEAKPAEANPCMQRNLARDFENPFKDKSSGKDSVEILSEEEPYGEEYTDYSGRRKG